jgi:hypothetical protein
MTALPMRPWQNALAIVAAFLVAGALLPWEYRLACALGAIGIVLLLAMFRIGAHRIRQQKAQTAGLYAKIGRIRADRKARIGRPGYDRSERKS